MTQSKDSDTITIKLDETYGATTSYLDNTGVTYTTDTYVVDDGTITLDLSDISIDGLVDTDGSYNFNWTFDTTPFVNTMPTIDEVNKMCEIYPGLAKAYENFKTAYKLVEQDYAGKKKAGEVDDDLPF
jgi:hypothetical protein